VFDYSPSSDGTSSASRSSASSKTSTPSSATSPQRRYAEGRCKAHGSLREVEVGGIFRPCRSRPRVHTSKGLATRRHAKRAERGKDVPANDKGSVGAEDPPTSAEAALPAPPSENKSETAAIPFGTAAAAFTQLATRITPR
jgi:hypothetical protein